MPSSYGSREPYYGPNRSTSGLGTVLGSVSSPSISKPAAPAPSFANTYNPTWTPRYQGSQATGTGIGHLQGNISQPRPALNSAQNNYGLVPGSLEYQQRFGGGGGGDGYATGATPALAQDPAFQAFMRALGLEIGHLNMAAEDRIRVIQNELNRRLPDIARLGELAREAISGNFEARGVYRSGQRIANLARQRADEGSQRSSLEGVAADQIALIRGELARRLAEANARGAEAGLTSAGNIYGQ